MSIDIIIIQIISYSYSCLSIPVIHINRFVVFIKSPIKNSGN